MRRKKIKKDIFEQKEKKMKTDMLKDEGKKEEKKIKMDILK